MSSEGSERPLRAMKRRGTSTQDKVKSHEARGHTTGYNEDFDAAYCATCREWLESRCLDPLLRVLSSSPRQTSVTVSLSSFSDSRTASLGSNWGNMTLALDNLAGGQADQLKWIKRPGRDSNPSTRLDRPGS